MSLNVYPEYDIKIIRNNFNLVYTSQNVSDSKVEAQATVTLHE